jgi:hypothetical protein
LTLSVQPAPELFFFPPKIERANPKMDACDDVIGAPERTRMLHNAQSRAAAHL